MRYLVLTMVCLAAVIAYVQRLALTVPTRTIQSDLGIDEQDVGLILGCWYWAYAVLQVPAGWVADRLGSKRALVLFVLLWSAFTGLAGLTTGPCLVAVYEIARLVAPSSRVTALTTVLTAMMSVGLTGGLALSGWWGESWGYRSAALVPVLSAAVLLATALTFVHRWRRIGPGDL